ncbi:hypothetical protein EYF80_054642 [Liparis tanakae]|uniref:Uncharacterized protein n=1 Tax=Liparis tanakae TaxID=230148 RepID=A0A4Z2F344_9TELE|nr:hypothetical protein EYF80_054642 [Liparis tanakae]
MTHDQSDGPPACYRGDLQEDDRSRLNSLIGQKTRRLGNMQIKAWKLDQSESSITYHNNNNNNKARVKSFIHRDQLYLTNLFLRKNLENCETPPPSPPYGNMSKSKWAGSFSWLLPLHGVGAAGHTGSAWASVLNTYLSRSSSGASSEKSRYRYFSVSPRKKLSILSRGPGFTGSRTLLMEV